jgi:hypothetical protein
VDEHDLSAVPIEALIDEIKMRSAATVVVCTGIDDQGEEYFDVYTEGLRATCVGMLSCALDRVAVDMEEDDEDEDWEGEGQTCGQPA